MSAAKHTPGPWRFLLESVTSQIEIFEIAEVSHFRIVCDTPGDGFSRAGEPIADARLIAAAPDLLEACQAINALDPQESSTGDWNEAFKLIAAAIAKATGVQQ